MTMLSNKRVSSIWFLCANIHFKIVQFYHQARPRHHQHCHDTLDAFSFCHSIRIWMFLNSLNLTALCEKFENVVFVANESKTKIDSHCKWVSENANPRKKCDQNRFQVKFSRRSCITPERRKGVWAMSVKIPAESGIIDVNREKGNVNEIEKLENVHGFAFHLKLFKRNEEGKCCFVFFALELISS